MTLFGCTSVWLRRTRGFLYLHFPRKVQSYNTIAILIGSLCNAEKFRFSAEFIELRRRALDVFVNRIASHPHLRQSEDLRNFLQADEEAWTMERTRSQEGSIFRKRPSDFIQMFKEVQAKVSDAVLGKDKPVEESDPDYEKLKHYIFELEEHLVEAQKQSFRLVKRYRDLAQTLSDFGKAVTLLGGCEGSNLGNSFTELGSQAELLSYKINNKAQELLTNFEEPMKEYVRTVQSIKITMGDRAQAFRQQRELTESAKLKEINLEKLRVVRPDKVLEAEVDFKETKAQSEAACKHFEMIVKLMQRELVRFQEEKTRDLGAVFYDFIGVQIQLANDTADAWRAIIPKLESCAQQNTVTST